MADRLDLTRGRIPVQLFRLSAPILFGMLVFTLYLMTDLYFVSRLGADAVAALSISSNVFFIHLGLAFIIGTGAMALIAQAFGAKETDAAKTIFEQSLLLSVVAGTCVAVTGYLTAAPYIRFFGGTGRAFEWGVQYFEVYSVSLLFLLLLHVFGACYRGMGDTKTSMKIMFATLVINMVFDPVLIFGLGGFPALGVRGAAIASLLSQVCRLFAYIWLVFIRQQHIRIAIPKRFDIPVIKKSLIIGLPSGLAYFLLTANMLITYRVISPYGTQALASIGIGYRIIQGMYLPSVAVADAMAAIVGQNVGAKIWGRVVSSFWSAWWFSTVAMALGMAICWLFPESLIRLFSSDPQVVHYGVLYLKIISLANIIVGTILTVSAVFQGIGKTFPSLVGAFVDNFFFGAAVFTLPAIFGWGITSVWWIKVSTGVFEMGLIAVWLYVAINRLKRSVL